MAEENIAVPAATEVAAAEPKQLSAVELKAAEGGWIPQEEWTGAPELWRPAKEFIDRGELIKRIEDQNRSMKDMRKSLEDLKSLHAKTREVEYSRALADLKSQKKIALEEGNADNVIMLDDQIDMVKTAQRQMQEPAKDVQAVHPEFTEWVDKNKWYQSDEDMRDFADARGMELSKKGMSPSAVLEEIEKKIRVAFPDKFKNPNRQKPGSVEGSVRTPNESSSKLVLSDTERQIMQRFVRTGGLTEKEYIDSLKNLSK